MSNKIKDKQKVSFNELLNVQLPQLISAHSFEKDDNYSVKFELYPCDLNNPFEENGTTFIIVKTKCTITNLESGEEEEIIIDLLKLPVYGELGFRVGNNYMQVLDSYDRASGWSFSYNQAKDLYMAKLSSISSNYGNSAKDFKKILCFQYEKGKYLNFTIGRNRETGNRKDNLTQVSISTFFRAITGLSNNELLELFGLENPYNVLAFCGDNSASVEAKKGVSTTTRNECINALAKAMLSYTLYNTLGTVAQRQNRITRMLFDKSYMDLGASNVSSLGTIQSFKKRAINKILAEDVVVCNEVVKAGTILNESILEKMDLSPIDEIIVLFNDKRYSLKKFSNFTFRALNFTLNEDVLSYKKGTILDYDVLRDINESELITLHVTDLDGNELTLNRRISADVLTIEDLYTAYSIFINNVNGFDTFDSQYELTDRIVVPFDKKVLQLINTHLDTICSILDKNLEYLKSPNASARKSYIEEHYSKREIEEGLVSEEDKEIEAHIVEEKDAINNLEATNSEFSIINAVSDFAQKINIDAFLLSIRNTTDPESQMSDITNIMSYQERNFKITPNFGNSQMIEEKMLAIQDMQFGRLDPLDQPESSKIGVVHHRTVLSKSDENGYLTSPFFRVNKCVVSEEPVYLTANEEIDKYVAEWNETFYDENGNKKERVNARYNGTVVTVDADAVTLKEFSQIQTMSPARLYVPFMNHSAGKRTQMACNHQKQAVPTFGGKRAAVGTGGECILDYGNYRASTILEDYYNLHVAAYPEIAQYKDVILNDSISLVKMNTENCIRTYTFKLNEFSGIIKSGDLQVTPTTDVAVPFMQNTPEKCVFSYRINANASNKFSGEDIVIYNLEYDPNSYDKNVLADYGGFKVSDSTFDSGIALGQDLMVVFKTFSSTTIDDSITISDRLVSDQSLSSITILQVEEELHQTGDKHEVFGISSSSRSYFSANGLPRLGTILKAGDPYVSKIVTNLDMSPAKKKQDVRLSFLGPTQEGQVVSASIVEKNNTKVARVLLATKSDIDVGDKMSGRCGNKGVVARIVPFEEMPYNPETGETADVCLNPQGVPSRMNLSQLLEVALGLAMHRRNEIAIISPFNTKGEDFVREMTEKENVHPAMLIDGRTGHYFERPINYGMLHMLKLTHMVKKKIHSIGTDHPIDAITLQPKHGAKRDGGQAFGEMESWCLQGMGATKLLHEIQSTASDDRINRAHLKKCMLNNPYHITMSKEEGTSSPESCSQNNSNDLSFQVFARSVGTEITTEQDEEGNTFYKFGPLKDSTIKTFSPSPIKSQSALHNPNIFGSADSALDKAKNRSRWGWIDLGTEMILPTWFYKGDLAKLIVYKIDDKVSHMTRETWLNIINKKLYFIYEGGYVQTCVREELQFLENSEGYMTGFSGLIELLKTYDVSITLKWINGKISSHKSKLEKKAAKKLNGMDAADDKQTSEALYSDVLLEYYKLKNYVEEFVASGNQLSDYVITALPVMPQVYRPEVVLSGINATSDFDWHYTQILNAVNNYLNSQTEDAKLQIFEAIKNFIGLKIDKRNKNNSKHANIISYFFGNKLSKRKDHGKIRETLQKKRLCRSGRSPIIPSQDPTMLPTQLGVPFLMCIKMWDIQLQTHLNNYCPENSSLRNSDWKNLLEAIANHNDSRFNEVYENKFEDVLKMKPQVAKKTIIKWVTDFIEGTHNEPTGPNNIVIEPQVVICGRQPSLHKFSVRAYHPKIVMTKAIQIHHLVCKGYNADFDGDQVYLYAPIFDETKEEAMRLLTVNEGVINPKNNGIILEHSQDIALGVYCATMLKDNAEQLQDNEKDNIHYYNSLEAISNDIDIRLLHLYDLVCYTHHNYNKYVSTAGRILFNSLIVGGFTDKPFTNTLGLNINKTDRIKDLLYDGLITSGSSNSKKLESYKLQNICEDLYLKHDSLSHNDDTKTIVAVDAYQKIMEFGFKYADLYGVSISIEDLAEISKDLNKNDVISKADEVKAMIEKDYQDGLVSEEDKKTAIANLYVGANKTISDKLLKVMNRNNNIFIMFDSGARGSKNQIVQSCGAIGILQKTGTENLETSVTTNYYEGLSSFDLQQTSYSTRLSVASTQNETRDAGHATRQSVYMESGLEIVEKDCGKKDWWFDILWGQPIKDKCVFKPNIQYFLFQFNGKKVWDSESMELFGDSLEDGKLTPSSFNEIEDGFTHLRIEGEVFDFSISEDTTKVEFSKVVGCKLLSEFDLPAEVFYDTDKITDALLPVLKEKGISSITVQDYEEITFDNLLMESKIVGPESALKILKNFLTEDGYAKQQLPFIIHKNFIKTLETDKGTFEFRYKMTEACRSLLTGRVAKDLKYLDDYYDPDFFNPNEKIQIITDKTLDYIEEEGIDRVKARILLDCETGRDESTHGKSHHGICALCYGLKFSNKKLPHIGDNVGVEAAQAIGEPAAQLTMNLVHAGGAAGASISGGVQLFNSLLLGSKIDGGKHDAKIANSSGYVKINQLDDLTNVSIIPYNKNCAMCKECNNRDLCSFADGDLSYMGKCLLPTKLSSKSLKYKDGEWINAGDALTEGYVLPQNIEMVNEVYDIKEIIRKKQMVCFLNYFNTFKNNNIFINARHFELLARLQNSMVTVIDSDNDLYVPGKKYEYSEILNAKGSIKYILNPSSQSEVIEQDSGALSLLSFEDVLSHMASYTNKGFRSYRNSSIGRINIGENLVTGKKKILRTSSGEFKEIASVPNNDVKLPEYIQSTVNTTEQTNQIDIASNLLDDLLSLDIDSTDVMHTVSATILNKESKNPFDYVSVKVFRNDTSSELYCEAECDENGNVYISDLPDGEYNFVAELEGFGKKTIPFTLNSDNISCQLGVIFLEIMSNSSSELQYLDTFDDDLSFEEEMQEPIENHDFTYNYVDDSEESDELYDNKVIGEIKKSESDDDEKKVSDNSNLETPNVSGMSYF